MIKCPHCNKQTNAESGKCEHCGKSLTSAKIDNATVQKLKEDKSNSIRTNQIIQK